VGKNPQQAVRNFLLPIERSTACLTTARITATGHDPAKQPHALTVNGGQPVAVTLEDDHAVEFNVAIDQNYRVIETGNDQDPWKVHTTKYVYSLTGADGAEIFSYHWHPGIGPNFPHMHVKATQNASVLKAHFRTGRVSLEHFIWVLLTDFGIRARKQGWKKILRASQEAFERGRTWA
jgi:hypothetical protein